MTFFMIGGIVCTVVAVVLIFIYITIRKIDENSNGAKIICVLGMVFGVASAALMTIEYSFPNISHPYVPTVKDHFVEFYGDSYEEFVINNTNYEITNFINVSHSQLDTNKENEHSYTNFKTEIIFNALEDAYEITLLNKYTYNQDYTYQTVVSKIIK